MVRQLQKMLAEKGREAEASTAQSEKVREQQTMVPTEVAAKAEAKVSGAK